MNKYSDAINDFNKGISLNPSDTIILNNRGFALMKVKEYDKAINDFNSSMKISPNNSSTYHYRAMTYIEKKDIPNACSDLKKALDLGFTATFGNEAETLYKKHCK